MCHVFATPLLHLGQHEIFANSRLDSMFSFRVLLNCEDTTNLTPKRETFTNKRTEKCISVKHRKR